MISPYPSLHFVVTMMYSFFREGRSALTEISSTTDDMRLARDARRCHDDRTMRFHFCFGIDSVTGTAGAALGHGHRNNHTETVTTATVSALLSLAVGPTVTRAWPATPRCRSGAGRSRRRDEPVAQRLVPVMPRTWLVRLGPMLQTQRRPQRRSRTRHSPENGSPEVLVCNKSPVRAFRRVPNECDSNDRLCFVRY